MAVTLGTVRLVDNRDYTVSYANNKEIGTATITITGKGSYTGTVKKTFKITKFKTVGSKAITSIKKTAVIDVPNKKLKTYKKLFKGSTGYKSSMKIK